MGVFIWFYISNNYQYQPINRNYAQTRQNDSKNSKKNNLSSNFETKPQAEPKPEPIFYSINHVVDGDTVAINISDDVMLIRIIGIDSPEIDSIYTKQECFGKEASAKLKELLNNKSVRVEYDDSQGMLDKYSRLLAHLFLENGTNVGGYMIDHGYAREYTFNKPYVYQKKFKDAEYVAQEQKLGLWAPDACIK